MRSGVRRAETFIEIGGAEGGQMERKMHAVERLV
jgi:hypothetical protein